MIEIMKLDVLEQREPWYGEGLNFTCTQCGNCCTGGPGFVWISPVEIDRLAKFLGEPAERVVKRYTRRFGDRLSLKERKTTEGLYDCIFLQHVPAEPTAENPNPPPKRICSIYSVRPLQCRTWPFWNENLASPENWERGKRRCPGMGKGSRHFSLEKIDSLKDAKDWPENPPTSGKP
jgi:Fe-S-cluster containining protein